MENESQRRTNWDSRTKLGPMSLLKRSVGPLQKFSAEDFQEVSVSSLKYLTPDCLVSTLPYFEFNPIRFALPS